MVGSGPLEGSVLGSVRTRRGISGCKGRGEGGGRTTAAGKVFAVVGYEAVVVD